MPYMLSKLLVSLGRDSRRDWRVFHGFLKGSLLDHLYRSWAKVAGLLQNSMGVAMHGTEPALVLLYRCHAASGIHGIAAALIRVQWRYGP